MGYYYKGTEVDIFALGVILFQLIFGRDPFFRAHPSDKFYKPFCDSNARDKLWNIYLKTMEIEEREVAEGEVKDLVISMM